MAVSIQNRALQSLQSLRSPMTVTSRVLPSAFQRHKSQVRQNALPTSSFCTSDCCLHRLKPLILDKKCRTMWQRKDSFSEARSVAVPDCALSEAAPGAVLVMPVQSCALLQVHDQLSRRVTSQQTRNPMAWNLPSNTYEGWQNFFRLLYSVFAGEPRGLVAVAGTL